MNFRTWLEIVEPVKPVGVRRTNIVKDKGTNVANAAIQFKWTTKLGNVVKLHFDHDGQENAYRVVFYVNDTLYDDAAKNLQNGRDSEILSGIFYLLTSKADKIGAEQLSFRGQKSDGDTRTVRNVDPDKYKMKAMIELRKFAQEVQQHQVQMVPPSETKINLWQKLNRGDPQPMPDFRKDIWTKWVANVNSAIEGTGQLSDLVNQLKTGIGVGDFTILYNNLDPLINALTNLSNAFISNSPEGWKKTKNRRTAIYTKLVQRHMANEWDIKINGDWFYLTRKMSG
jgi:hypothetical protein